MTFEQLHDLYFSQPEAKLDEQALRYFWNSAVEQAREALGSVDFLHKIGEALWHVAGRVGEEQSARASADGVKEGSKIIRDAIKTALDMKKEAGG